MSLRRKITAAILVTFVLTLPTVSMSIFYFSGLLEKINIIIEQDVTLGRMANDLSVTMLDIQRYERNYRVFGTSAERQSVKRLVADAESMLHHIQEIAPNTEQQLVKELSDHLSIYSNTFDMLADHISAHPPEDRIKKIRTRFSKNLSDFQSKYREILTELDRVTDAERDSIIARTTESMDALSFDRLFDIETSTDESTQPFYIQENLDNSSQAFLETAYNLAEKSWENMLTHRNESFSIEARAKRNIIFILIVTGIICIFMVTLLPRNIVRPITSLIQALNKAREGDFSAQAHIQTNDEIGDLATSYNYVIERFRHYDDLKTRKIASQKRTMDRLLENLQLPVCIVSPELNASYYNHAFADIFGTAIPPKPPDGGMDLEKIESMNDFTEQLKKKIEGGTNNFFLTVTSQDGKSFTLKGRLVLNAVMEPESIVLIEVPEEA